MIEKISLGEFFISISIGFHMFFAYFKAKDKDIYFTIWGVGVSIILTMLLVNMN